MVPIAQPIARRIAIIAAVWVVVAGAALLMARALDDPVGAGAPDAARPEAPGEVAAPSTASPAAPAGLPPLALVVDAPVPPDLRGLSVSAAAVKLRDRVLAGGGSAADWVRLGSLLQLDGRGPMAAMSYQQALRLAPGDLTARTGLALVDGAQGGAAATRGARALAALARQHPRAQVVRFNEGLLALYRGRRGDAVRAWRATIAAGPGTRLGLFAAKLVSARGTAPSGRNP